jgi:glycosyltransferase involved in cell wall biosynthesis
MNNENRKKRILYHFMIGITAGGSDTCLHLLIKNLDKSRYDPKVIYMDRSKLVDDLQNQGIKLIPMPEKIRARYYYQIKKNAEAISHPPQKETLIRSIRNRLGNFGLLIRGLKDIIKKLPDIYNYMTIIVKNKIDIVHANHHLSGDRSMLLAAIILRRKVVSHNRGLYSPDLIDVYISKFIDQIVSMSDFSTSVYVKGGVLEARCKTIYDGIDPEEFKSSGAESTKVTVGCFGRLEKWKGQHVLVESAEIIVSKLPGIRFFFVGKGNNENELKYQVQRKGLEEYFEFTGHVTNVIDYMNQSTIIVHTSIEPEPFGMVIIEAMALEKPVIATSIGGPLEIIDHEIDGFLIPPMNPTLLAENIIRLAKDIDLRTQIGKKARGKVIKKFDVRHYTKQIEAVYDKLF